LKYFSTICFNQKYTKLNAEAQQLKQAQNVLLALNDTVTWDYHHKHRVTVYAQNQPIFHGHNT